MAEHGGLSGVAGQHLDVSSLYRCHHLFQALDVHRLGEAVAQRLEDQRMVRDLDVAGRGVVLALNLRREDRGQQVVRAHSKQRRRHLPPRREPEQREAARCVPPPSYAEQRRLKDRLTQHLLGVAGLDVPEHLLQRERERRSQREVDAVVGGRRLQLEVEGAAYLLAQRHPPGAVDGGPKGRVDHQLHAAGLVEEPLGDDALLGRDHTEDSHSLSDVCDRLLGGIARDARFLNKPALAVAGLDSLVQLFAKVGHLVGELGCASGSLAQPEGDGRRGALRILDPDPPTLDAADPPGRVPQQEDVAATALDGEVLVHGSHEDVLRLGDDVVVGVVGFGAAAGERGQAGATPPTQLAVDDVVVKVGTAAAIAGCYPLREHLDHLVVSFSRQLSVRVRLAHQVEKLVLIPLPRGALSHHLLGQNVQWPGRYLQPVQVAATDAAHQRHALHELVSGQREEAALRRAAQVVAGATHPLQQQPQGPRRAHLAHQVYRPDVDAELQGRRRYAHPDLSSLQPLLGLVAPLL